MKSPATSISAGAAAAAYGAPPQVGTAGAQIGASLCKRNEVPTDPADMRREPVQSRQYDTSKWVLPAVIGGAGLIVVFLVARK